MKKNIIYLVFGLVLIFAISSCKTGDCGCPKFEIESKTKVQTEFAPEKR